MKLSTRQADDSTLRDNLLSAQKQHKRPDPLLDRDLLPACVRHLWDLYCDIGSARSASMGGATLVPPSEIKAWLELQKIQLTPWELETIRSMDRAAVEVMNTTAAERRKAAALARKKS